MRTLVPASAQYLVVYTHYPQRYHLRLLRKVLGEEVSSLDLVMPLVVPFTGHPTISLTIAYFPDNFDVIVQPSEDEIPPMPLAEALQLARADEAWVHMLRAWNVEELYSLSTREFPRFWLLLPQAASEGIPPGLGFIVDKWSRRVLSRRFIDVWRCIETGGPAAALHW
jgi:hypothetical protein